jgi:hypothetical protein
LPNLIEFRAERILSSPGVQPWIDGVPLAEMAKAFEVRWDKASQWGYAGIIPHYFNLGPLDEYFLGRPGGRYFASLGGIHLLTCGGCGEIGCWSLVCSVDVTDANVTWRGFRHPNRKAWDYTGFGPFVFDRAQYRDALRALPEP